MPLKARSGAAFPSRVRLTVLAFLMEAACLAQLPFLQDNTLAKAGLTLAEILVFLVMFWSVRNVPGLRRWVAIAVAFVFIRFCYAWLIGYLRYDSTLTGALQEGRFGFLIIIAPVAFAFFRYLTVKKLGELLFSLAVALVFADVLVTWFFVRTGYISLADRVAGRYVLSVIPLVFVIWLRLITAIRSGEKPPTSDMAILAVMALHIAIFSTSRSEAILCGAVLCQWIYVRLPNLRWPLLGVVAVAIFLFYVSLQPESGSLAGRDYRLALIYARDAFPFGVGLVPEAVQKVQLGTAGNFFASDYGPILLVYRYGMVGITIGFCLLAFWLRFLARTLTIPGTFVVSAGILAYILIVPLLDYGSMNGGILLGSMAAVYGAAPQRKAMASNGLARSNQSRLSRISR